MRASKVATMTALEGKRQRRLMLMRRLYELTDGRYMVEVPVRRLAEDLGWSLDETKAHSEYLQKEGLIESTDLEGLHLTILHPGVVEVEEALEHPDWPTDHFEPVNVVVNGDVIGSQIQAGTHQSSQWQDRVSVSDQRPAIADFLDAFRQTLDDPKVPTPEHEQIAASIATVDAQLAAPEPSETIVRESLRTLRSIAENLAASGLWVGLLDLAQRIHF